MLSVYGSPAIKGIIYLAPVINHWPGQDVRQKKIFFSLPASEVIYYVKVIGGGSIEPIIGPLLTPSDATTSFDFASRSIEAFFLKPDDVDILTKTSWVGAYVLTPPFVIVNHFNRLVNSDFYKNDGVKDIPVLYIHGKDDMCLRYEPILEYVQGIYNHVKVCIVEGSGHAVFYEKPDEVRTAILDFVNTQ